MTHRRFNGVAKLYDLNKLTDAHVYVIGIGGVGSWVVEGLARTAVGELTLIDMDVLVESNVNRQLPALTDTFGESKIEVMARRAKGINPNIMVHCVDDFLTAENVGQMLPNKELVTQLKAQGRQVVVLDCTDDMTAKLAIALHCRFNKIKLIVSGGAGGKIDPTLIQVADLKDVSQDPLLARLRHKLREKNINKPLKEKFAIKCVYSTEMLKTDAQCDVLGGLRCGGYGSAVVVTATVGMTMVAECLKMIEKSG